MIARAQFLEAVQATVGTPFGAHGRLLGVALDCVGVLVCALRACGVEVQDRVEHYGNMPSGLHDRLAQIATPIAREDRQAGDVLTFFVAGESRHLGVLVHVDTRRDWIVHAKQNTGWVVKQPLPASLAIAGCWRLKEVAPWRR